MQWGADRPGRYAAVGWWTDGEAGVIQPEGAILPVGGVWWCAWDGLEVSACGFGQGVA